MLHVNVTNVILIRCIKLGTSDPSQNVTCLVTIGNALNNPSVRLVILILLAGIKRSFAAFFKVAIIRKAKDRKYGFAAA